MRKTLIVNDIAPPLVIGGAIIIGKLFKYFHKDNFFILTNDYLANKNLKIDQAEELHCKYFFCRVPDYESKSKWHRRINIIWGWLQVPAIVLKGLKIVKKYRIKNIFAPINKGIFLFSAFLISKIAKKDLFLYLPDIYEEIPRTKIEKFIAKEYSYKMFSSAKKVFVVNESLADHYWKKYRIRTEIIPNPVDLSVYKNKRFEACNLDKSIKKIVFTGGLYWAHLDAFLNMLEVVNSFSEDRIKLFVYTAQDKKDLRKMGVWGKNVVIDYAPRNSIPSIQKEADVLFLPLSFNPLYSMIVKTASTTKLPEYLGAARPILIHAPGDYFISQYAKKNRFGLVVETLDVNTLKNAVLRLLSDKYLQEELIEKSIKTVKTHDLIVVSEKLKYFLYA